MSRTSPQEKRLRLFEQGNTHCPICLTEFTEPEVRAGEAVTLEHAPQESLGGKPACLTCMKCNTGPATGMIDQAVARFYRAQEQGGYPITVEGDGKRPYTVHPKHYDIEKGRIRIRTRRDVVGKSHGPFTLRQERTLARCRPVGGTEKRVLDGVQPAGGGGIPVRSR